MRLISKERVGSHWQLIVQDTKFHFHTYKVVSGPVQDEHPRPFYFQGITWCSYALIHGNWMYAVFNISLRVSFLEIALSEGCCGEESM